ncbi:lysozyme [Methylobacterium sp. 275MFSha3.1]|uniref:lysozyme n=1 Tax=Methylobacterium sp. 275MFSha3.1 TaxID=1502746 RepID=UPI0008A804BA|nr:lysozyme [Methylobacterium sp. 275MFSha3.1]SEH35272.1 lysozyme [Methylobacterium sp. 275MFSha3.1]
MDLSPLGRAALAAREGCRLRAYRDSVGVWTIGRGHTSAAGPPAVIDGMTLTQAEADALFAADLLPYVASVRAALAKPVPQPFFDACCSLCFNIGQANFAHASLVRLANASDLPQAVEAFLLWDRPTAILARRQGERDQAALPTYGLVYARRGDPAPVRAPERPALAAPARPDPLVPMTGTADAAAESWWLRLRDAIRHNMQTGA